MIYAILGALAIGLSLGIFGSGGSILTVPILVYLLDRPDKAAIAESLAIVGAIALLGALPYAREKLVHWRSVWMFGLPAMAGTYLGAWLAAYVAGAVQLLVFAAVMLVAAVLMWKRASPHRPKRLGQTEPPRRHLARIAAEGVAVGALTGFVGVGGGFLIVPALVIMGGLPMRNAVATSLLIIAMKSAVGFLKYLSVLDRFDLAVDWETIAAFIAVGAVGSFAGQAVSGKIDQRKLKRGFAVFLLIMALFIAAREGASLLSA